MPFVVGIYEMEVNRMDAELAQLFEDYFQSAFRQMLAVKPQFHRVIPINESVRNSMEVHPCESAAEIVNAMQSWGVTNCICRKQKALIGQACEHPIDVCMVLSSRENAFEAQSAIHSLTRMEAMDTLQRAALAGLVHSVSNSREGVYYICNCCKCSCGILRGMAELGIANVVASSAFVNQVDDALCGGCEACISSCQFDALVMDGQLAKVDTVRCVGCGVCVIACSTGALGLVRRYLGLLVLALSVPVGVATALYLEEYANRERWYNRLSETNIQNLAAVPSIVYGILGLAFIVRGIGIGRVVFAGALILTLVVLPTVIVASREAIRTVPDSIRQGGFALGATKWQVVLRQVLPASIPGIATGSILALSRAVGVTAPLANSFPPSWPSPKKACASLAEKSPISKSAQKQRSSLRASSGSSRTPGIDTPPLPAQRATRRHSSPMRRMPRASENSEW